MGRIYETIDDTLRAWIAQQPVYFVGSAPASTDGHVNISPKGGMQTFAVLGDRRVAYVDLVGSGIETTAHLQENGRIVIMFCAMSGPPKILRFHGRGLVVPESSSEFPHLLSHFTIDAATRPLVRSVIVVEVERISDSCGFVVPEMTFKDERTQLQRWAVAKENQHGSDWKLKYLAANNAKSIDGLPTELGIDVSAHDSGDLSSSGKSL